MFGHLMKIIKLILQEQKKLLINKNGKFNNLVVDSL
jgi:hypothetical protein